MTLYVRVSPATYGKIREENKYPELLNEDMYTLIVDNDCPTGAVYISPDPWESSEDNDVDTDEEGPNSGQDHWIKER